MDEKIQREQLIEDHMGLAVAVAVSVWNTAKHALDLDELKSIAFLALVASAHRWRTYCDEKNYSHEDTHYFKAVAQRRIRGAIYDYLRSSDWATRTLRTREKIIRAAIPEGEDNYGRRSVKDISTMTGLTENAVRSTMSGMARKPVSLDIQEIDYTSIKQTHVPDASSDAFVNRITGAFVKAYWGLSVESQVVVALRYHQNLNMKEIAIELEIQTSRVSELHNKAILALHKAMIDIVESEEI